MRRLPLHHGRAHPEEAVEHPARTRLRGRDARGRDARDGYPAYTTSAGWLGYDDEKVEALVREAVATASRREDEGRRRPRDDDAPGGPDPGALGPDGVLMMDANQVWGVDEAIAAMRARAPDPWWIEEPTSPDDILGHARIRRAIAPVRVATGEHVQNRMVFKQLFQAEAIDVCQLDACRLGGVNEAMRCSCWRRSSRPGVPPRRRRRAVRVRPAPRRLRLRRRERVAREARRRVGRSPPRALPRARRVRGRALRAPLAPGYSIEMLPASLDEFEFPNGVHGSDPRSRVGGAANELEREAQPWFTAEHAIVRRTSSLQILLRSSSELGSGGPRSRRRRATTSTRSRC